MYEVTISDGSYVAGYQFASRPKASDFMAQIRSEYEERTDTIGRWKVFLDGEETYRNGLFTVGLHYVHACDFDDIDVEAVVGSFIRVAG